MLGVVLADPVDPPLRVVPDRLRVFFGDGDQLVALTQKPAQTTVDKTGLVGGGFAAFCSFDGLINQRMRRVRRLVFAPNQRQNNAQERVCFRRRRASGELLAQGFCAAQPAQGMKPQGLNTGT